MVDGDIVGICSYDVQSRNIDLRVDNIRKMNWLLTFVVFNVGYPHCICQFFVTVKSN